MKNVLSMSCIVYDCLPCLDTLVRDRLQSFFNCWGDRRRDKGWIGGKGAFSYSTLALTLSVGIVRKRSGSCFK